MQFDIKLKIEYPIKIYIKMSPKYGKHNKECQENFENKILWHESEISVEDNICIQNNGGKVHFTSRGNSQGGHITQHK